jgi:glycosyltransferase involved in cell wall biosynthesis
MKLSVIVPVVNEAHTIGPILERVLAVPLEKEVIVVDDGSTDGTWQALQRYASSCTLVRHAQNQGKGAAIATALGHVTGDIVITQDADLEYDPEDYPKLIDPIARGTTDVVYGSRLLNGRSPTSRLTFYLGGRFLTWLANVLYGSHITDEPTGYKVFRTKVIRSLPLVGKGFEFCPEVTALLGLRHIPIVEVPIGYHPRSISEGKKIRWRDGLMAIWTLIRYRFSRSAQFAASARAKSEPVIRHP